MAHIPINHRNRGILRFLAGLAGLYVLLFGIVGAARTSGQPFFDRSLTEALGLRTNLAFSILSIVVGAVVLVSAIMGRNFDHFVNLAAGIIFWVAGLAMLALMQTDANKLNFTVSTVVVSYLIGTVLVVAGLYGKTGSAEQAREEEIFRHSGRGAKIDVPDHTMSAHPDIKHAGG